MDDHETLKSHNLNKEDKLLIKEKSTLSSVVKLSNIWDEPSDQNTIIVTDKVIEFATLNKIIEIVTSPDDLRKTPYQKKLNFNFLLCR